MVFPTDKEVYLYNGKKYVVLSSGIFSPVWVFDYLEDDDSECGEFHEFNWWSFMFHAKHIGTTKRDSVY